MYKKIPQKHGHCVKQVENIAPIILSQITTHVQLLHISVKDMIAHKLVVRICADVGSCSLKPHTVNWSLSNSADLVILRSNAKVM